MKIVQHLLKKVLYALVNFMSCSVELSHGPMNWIISFVQWIQLLYSNWNDIRRSLWKLPFHNTFFQEVNWGVDRTLLWSDFAATHSPFSKLYMPKKWRVIYTCKLQNSCVLKINRSSARQRTYQISEGCGDC